MSNFSGRKEISFDPSTISRPDDSLLTYYLLVSIPTLLAFPVVFIRFYVRFKTLRYRFDDEGVSMSWGLLFHHQVYLTYRRIQDIHVTRNLIERWMGLAKVPIQTASGTTGATMVIEGIRNPEPLRDFLYERMRGARQEQTEQGPSEDNRAIALKLLTEIRDLLRALSEEREARRE